jgi:hypothetical protein
VARIGQLAKEGQLARNNDPDYSIRYSFLSHGGIRTAIYSSKLTNAMAVQVNKNNYLVTRLCKLEPHPSEVLHLYSVPSRFESANTLVL